MSTLAIDAQAWAIRRLHSLAHRLHPAARQAPHLALGLRGEREALFELRRQGCTVVARRWHDPKLRGDIDLIAWDGSRDGPATLCFIEVKTRSERRSATPAETAVDRDKQTNLRRLAYAYLHRFPEDRRRSIPVRFDVLAVYLHGPHPEFELFRAAFPLR